MPPVEEWSCLVTIEERMVRLEETTEAQESSHDVSMPRINPSFGSDDVDMLLRKEMFDARRTCRRVGAGGRSQAELLGESAARESCGASFPQAHVGSLSCTLCKCAHCFAATLYSAHGQCGESVEVKNTMFKGLSKKVKREHKKKRQVEGSPRTWIPLLCHSTKGGSSTRSSHTKTLRTQREQTVFNAKHSGVFHTFRTVRSCVPQEAKKEVLAPFCGLRILVYTPVTSCDPLLLSSSGCCRCFGILSPRLCTEKAKRAKKDQICNVTLQYPFARLSFPAKRLDAFLYSRQTADMRKAGFTHTEQRGAARQKLPLIRSPAPLGI